MYQVGDIIRVIGVDVYCGEYYDDKALTHVGKTTVIDVIVPTISLKELKYGTKLGWWAETEVELAKPCEIENIIIEIDELECDWSSD